MADRGGRTIPGQVYIEVEYDYEYEAKDKKIVIKQGERYILVKKTNDDWWQVKPDENSKAFYVPAQYVKEVGRKALMPPVKPVVGLLNNSTKMIQRSTENVNKSPELSSFGKSSSIHVTGLVRDANQNFGPNSSPGQTISLDLVPNNGKFNSDSQSPKISSQTRTHLFGHFSGPEFIDIEKTSFSHEQSCDSAGEGSERIHHDSESGDELSSSSTEQIRDLVAVFLFVYHLFSKSVNLDCFLSQKLNRMIWKQMVPKERLLKGSRAGEFKADILGEQLLLEDQSEMKTASLKPVM